MPLDATSSRLLTLIAGLSTAGQVSSDVQTLAARAGMDIEPLRAQLAELIAGGLVSRELNPLAPSPGITYQLTFDGWDIVDDAAAVDPRADLDAKQREYSRAAAAVTALLDGGRPSPVRLEGDFTRAVEAEELAKHRYDRALARYERRRVSVAAR